MVDYQTLLDLIPAYALDALETSEKQAVEALLAEDEVARQFLADYRAMTHALLLSVPHQTPPPNLEAKLRARIRRKPHRPIPLQGVFLLAALLIGVMVGMVLVQKMRPEQSAKDLYLAIAEEPNSRRLTLIPMLEPETQGDLVYRAEPLEAVIRVSNLPPLQEGQAFQLWLIDDKGDTSGGIFQFDEQTHYIRVPLTEPLEAYTRFGMTIEPETGSPLGNQSSGEKVFSIPVELPSTD